jgi:hypothetical protein
MPPYPALFLVFLGACATQTMAVSSGTARFTEYPDSLFQAVESACDGPAKTFSRPSADLVECREFLPPEPTAAIILKFDGTPQNLPQLVIRFRTHAEGPGYLVENDIFLNVPQKSGDSLQVRQQDARLSHTLDALYQRSGGIPE